MQKQIEAELEKIGFETEKRAFKPHLTLGRVNSSRGKDELIERVEKRQAEVFGDFEVEVEAPQGEIGLGHLGDEADHHAVPDILGSEQLGLRSLGGAAEFSPEVQFPSEGKAGGRCKVLRRMRPAHQKGKVLHGMRHKDRR